MRNAVRHAHVVGSTSDNATAYFNGLVSACGLAVIIFRRLSCHCLSHLVLVHPSFMPCSNLLALSAMYCRVW